MKDLLRLLPAVAMLVSTSAGAQDWDREKYPDYDPAYCNPEPALVKYVQKQGSALSKRQARALARAAGLPEYVNNASTKYFPPVFNQSGGSCGSASRIAYMFTHELNAYRGADASLAENQYPTHFVWLLTNGNSGKEAFVMNVGVPNAATYGGQTYSSQFGYQEETYSDFGWMTGYDKWFSGFFNRMKQPTTNPYHLGTEEGRLAAKAWLYNHAGEEGFLAGGVIGLGVASGGDWKKIGSTPTNDSIGVTNRYYVNKWGTQVDHALTMVGYDDRIEFDLDGNGIFGEESKDEKGAWIIVNSWGDWCNSGFIYCPYAYAGSRFNADGTFGGDWWYGELYHTRKDYRPLRTIKLKMDYSRRSELLLQAGVSADLTATLPDQLIAMDHFKYAGDGANGNATPAPEVPMLGKWADGKLHTEPMEFGYDLTDLTANFDRNQPLKYFFIVNTKPTAVGNGTIYGASIIDYEHDRQGVETPFDLGAAGQVEVRNAGNQTIISVVVSGAAFNAPQNLAAAGHTLTWDAPLASAHTLQGYLIYKDGEKLGQVDANTRTYAFTEGGSYGVSALYQQDTESDRVNVNTGVEKQGVNEVITLDKGGFTIPDLFAQKFEDCTIEFYFKPTSMRDWNNAFGPGWGAFYAHCNGSGQYTVGWNTGSHRMNTSTKLPINRWTHVTIVVQKNKMSLYLGSSLAGVFSSNTYSGLGGFGNLVFSSGAGSNSFQECAYDEIRIWNKARTAAEVRATQNREFYGEVMPEGLLAYYKGDVLEKDGKRYLRDCVGGYHALLHNSNYVAGVPDVPLTIYRPKDNTNILNINSVEGPVYAGVPVKLSATRGDGINALIWSSPEAGLTDCRVVSPSLTFPSAGTYEVTLRGTDYEADGPDGVAREAHDTLRIEVVDAPAPDANFTATAQRVPSGDRVSFHASSVRPGYAYRWAMPGADVEAATTVSAGAAYQGAGTYTVTLTVTAPNGATDEQSLNLVVEEVAPKADFTLSHAVVMKGEEVTFKNTSKHKPTALQWTLDGEVQNIVVNGGENFKYVPTEPGVYDISLQATNEVGSDTKVQNRALIVTNADSKNGLSFSQSAAKVTLAKPLFDEESTQNLTIEWWMNPGKLTDYCQGIGQTSSTFMLRTDSYGRMFFQNGTRAVNSGSDFVIAGQWHHYAVTYSRGTVKFYRDGELVRSATGAGTTLACPSTFSLGTGAAPMTGSIDEFRVWKSTLPISSLQDFCNQPLEDPEKYITGEKQAYALRVYYSFNQNGGDVQDLTSLGNTGLRTGFGPDGDSWDLSKGVFCLNFGSRQDDLIVDGLGSVQPDATRSGALEGVYTLSGLRLGGQGGLRPGIYIQQGKKILVK